MIIYISARLADHLCGKALVWEGMQWWQKIIAGRLGMCTFSGFCNFKRAVIAFIYTYLSYICQAVVIL